MPRNDADDELLPEIDDDAIVAQQAEAHAPAPRVQVTEEARTIVVDEPAGGADDTTKVPAVTRGRNDPTMVIRAVRHPLPYVLPPQQVPARSAPAWLPWLIWGIAGVIALALGGALALVENRRAKPPAVQPKPPPPTAVTN